MPLDVLTVNSALTGAQRICLCLGQQGKWLSSVRMLGLHCHVSARPPKMNTFALFTPFPRN
jgi:hypothetical protein